MLSAGLRNRILAARDARQELLSRASRQGGSAVVFLSLNLPGEDKSPPGMWGLFRWAGSTLTEALPGWIERHRGFDALGPFALFTGEGEAASVKRRCMELEAAHPIARLIDFDVYDGGGRSIDRNLLGLPPRECLLCPEPARECIRLQRHGGGELKAKVHELLAPFID
jgi:holo-ACP synthase CitX